MMTTLDWIGVISTLTVFGVVFAFGAYVIYRLIRDAISN